HPGCIADRMLDQRTLRAYFRGGVAADYVRGERVTFFEADREVRGTIIDADAKDNGRWKIPTSVTGRVPSPVTKGTPGVFELGEGRIRGGKFYSRVCDDLAGAAACLTMLDELTRKPATKSPVAVLLTRAEEEGFVGAIAAVKSPKLLKKSDRVIAIECSSV